ncbi:MAG: Gfo/Idh/MocA family oxidoreductase [Acidobacteria bacterium]|jgi:predicted dehydrogenase|nr:Gfo/Idh/MocA family oxidoreductase [Acidobacteriota bacterium]
MKEKIKIGIIGTGFARTAQIPAFQTLSNAEIVSVASGHLENAEKTANDFGIAHFTDDWRETIEKDIGLVCITTPPNTHQEMTLFALERGIAVLCEKPMAMNVAEAEEMTEKADEKGVLALIDHELRFTNGRRKAFEILRSDKIGKVMHAKYHFCNASRGDRNLAWSWWSDEAQGGGALGAIGSHVIDTFRWFLGTEISHIFCQLSTHVKQRPDEKSGELREVTSDDETLMILRFADGDLTTDATANVSISVVEAGNYQNRVEFFGTKGALRIEDGGEIYFADIKENVWKQIEVDLGEVPSNMKVGGWSRGFLNFSHELVEALQAGKTEIENAATFEDGLKVQEVLDAARLQRWQAEN